MHPFQMALWASFLANIGALFQANKILLNCHTVIIAPCSALHYLQVVATVHVSLGAGDLEAGGGDLRQPRVTGVADGLSQRAEVVVRLHAARRLPLVTVIHHVNRL